MRENDIPQPLIIKLADKALHLDPASRICLNLTSSSLYILDLCLFHNLIPEIAAQILRSSDLHFSLPKYL